MSATAHAQQAGICLIGGGNMGRAIVGGLLAKNFAASSITVIDPDQQARAALERDHAVTSADAVTDLSGYAVVILAVKPQIMMPLVQDLAGCVRPDEQLFMSVAAGVRSAQLARLLGREAAIVRVMPNTPALIGVGAAAMHANAAVTPTQKALAEQIMRAVGIACWVEDEALLDVVTALSGSGPAYYFLLMELLESAACKLGLAPEVARQLGIETAHGAALLARQSEHGPATLREQVTSPGGTTERALAILQSGGLAGLVDEALRGACERAQELAKEVE